MGEMSSKYTSKILVLVTLLNPTATGSSLRTCKMQLSTLRNREEELLEAWVETQESQASVGCLTLGKSLRG